jgi:hypothetical protein
MTVMPPAQGRPAASIVAIAIVAIALAILHPSPSRAGDGVVLVGAGDIGDCRSQGDEKTAHLLHSIPGTVFTAGDNAYPTGSSTDFANCYDPTWGHHDWRTLPSPGNHEYETADAAAYFSYFGSRAGPAGLGYYAYTRGTWRIYSLNSEVLDQAQLDWLRADLAAHPSQCSMAYWHRPLRSSGFHGNYLPVKDLWWPLYEAGVEIIVNGHDHDYERFAPMRPDGFRDPMGIREFVVGTGGTALRSFAAVKPNSQARNGSVHGVLKLYLANGSYSWRFVSVDGSYSDNGSYRCHGRP